MHGRWHRIVVLPVVLWYDVIIRKRKERHGMRLGCTKKLLEYLGVKPERSTEPVETIFEWTANLIVLNRRKTLVMAPT